MLTILPLLTLLPAVLGEGLYTRSSPVLQVDGRSYRDLIEKSNHTTILEFYAPWCGHCKNLAPAFEKAAKSLSGLAKVAAVNCDEESNKQFCGSMGVQGFPTMKIVKPGKKAGKPIVEDYQGARTAKAIVDAVVEKIPNHVRRLKDADYERWLEEGGSERAKAILFSDKGTVSALLKAIAVDFLGVIDVAQIRDKEKEANEVFNIEKFPTLVLLPGDGKDPVHYNGGMKKDEIVKFLSQAASPNPDPAPSAKKEKKPKSSSSSTNKSKASKSSSAFSKASASHESADSADSASAKATQTSETATEPGTPPTSSPDPAVVTEASQKPVKVPTAELAPPIQSLQDGLSLQQKCLNTKGGTCVLLLLPEGMTAETVPAISGLSEIAFKHSQAKRNLFPFYQLPASNSQGLALRTKLGLKSDTVEVVAVNGKRGWYRHYSAQSFKQAEIEDWVDAIRMGDLPKSSIPEGLLVPAEGLPQEPVRMEIPGFHEGMNKEEIRNAMRGQMPEGVDFEIEEIDDDEYERLKVQDPEVKGQGTQEDPVVVGEDGESRKGYPHEEL
ncbi:hypothetical protein LTR15_011234 [Elasticomyces elasticus]|nr:hypothetical protein LTR15_011234 [Elasticomyces elasticus]